MLAKGLVQLAKGSRYPDLAMVYAIAQLPDLVNRLDHAVNRPQGHPYRLDPWITPSFSQLLSSKEAEKTVAGIRATAESAYSAFIQKDLLRAFIGHSTVPARLEGKQLVIFKLDDRRRSVLSPLLAACLHLAVVSNLATKRFHPFFYGLDELPSINLPDLVYWVNEYRSNGGIPIVGIQSLNQLYDAYGDKRGAAIASALSTHVLFNPADYDTAEKYSKRYGETEITIRTRSTGRSSGIHPSRSTNWSEQLHKKPLLSPDQIMRLPQGKCVITSPAYGNEHEALFPYLLKIPVPKADRQRSAESEQLWDTTIHPQLERRAARRAGRIEVDRELELRLEEAYRLLPHPNEPDPVATTEETSSSGPQRRTRSRLASLRIGARSHLDLSS